MFLLSTWTGKPHVGKDGDVWLYNVGKTTEVNQVKCLERQLTLEERWSFGKWWPSLFIQNLTPYFLYTLPCYWWWFQTVFSGYFQKKSKNEQEPSHHFGKIKGHLCVISRHHCLYGLSECTVSSLEIMVSWCLLCQLAHLGESLGRCYFSSAHSLVVHWKLLTMLHIAGVSKHTKGISCTWWNLPRVLCPSIRFLMRFSNN